ncbi:MAG: helix-turn-helix domain-containing protein [Lachnospiraceae bacterium]|nr:helix-turn-helix domain-containing protein [Lachnospiraceae bacterium]
MRALLVDDEPFAIQGILDSVRWKEWGIGEVLTANSASSAKVLLKKSPVDIMLCDIEMPQGSGIDLVEWMRNESIDTLCIFLTAHSDFSFAQKALQMQCFDYILKPASPEKIEEVLCRALSFIRTTRKNTEYQNYGELYIKNVIGRNEAKEEEKADAVDACVDYIREHISDPLSVEEMAEHVFISPDHLTRMFKKRFGQTVTDYIREQRMFLAREMLENTDLSVTMISAKVGYDNYSAFITSFRKYYGMPPREYRQSRSE